MHFFVNPGDGGGGRIADTIHFVTPEVTYTLAGNYGGAVLMDDGDGDDVGIEGVNEVGHQIARMLCLYRDYSLVVDATPGRSMRGDEQTTADVYPPQRHPRITVKG